MTNENERKRMARRLWLRYFNRHLRDAGLVTERDYQAILRAIEREGGR